MWLGRRFEACDWNAGATVLMFRPYMFGLSMSGCLLGPSGELFHADIAVGSQESDGQARTRCARSRTRGLRQSVMERIKQMLLADLRRRRAVMSSSASATQLVPAIALRKPHLGGAWSLAEGVLSGGRFFLKTL